MDGAPGHDHCGDVTPSHHPPAQYTVSIWSQIFQSSCKRPNPPQILMTIRFPQWILHTDFPWFCQTFRFIWKAKICISQLSSSWSKIEKLWSDGVYIFFVSSLSLCLFISISLVSCHIWGSMTSDQKLYFRLHLWFDTCRIAWSRNCTEIFGWACTEHRNQDKNFNECPYLSTH